jgi:peptide/nickel transport system substrate-binding protein
MEAAAAQTAHREKTHMHMAVQGSAAFGSAASRLEAFVTSTGAESWIKDPEIDAWFAQQATARDRQTRQTLLHRIQQKLYDEACFLPLLETPSLNASGPRVAVSGLGMIPSLFFSAPYEDVQLKP